MTHPYPVCQDFLLIRMFLIWLQQHLHYPLCTSWPIKTRCKVCQHETEPEYRPLSLWDHIVSFCRSVWPPTFWKPLPIWEFWESQKYHNDRTNQRWGRVFQFMAAEKKAFISGGCFCFLLSTGLGKPRKQGRHSDGLECSKQRKAVPIPRNQWLPSRGQTDSANLKTLMVSQG